MENIQWNKLGKDASNEEWLNEINRILEKIDLVTPTEEAIQNSDYDRGYFHDHIVTLKELTAKTLSSTEAIQRPPWSEAIKKLIDLTPSAKDLLMDSGFSEDDLEDIDEEEALYDGGIMDGVSDFHQYTADFCYQSFMNPEVSKRSDFTETLMYVIKQDSEKVGAGLSDDDLNELLNMEHVKNHKDYEVIKKLSDS
ncbi:hypothetical protein K1F50_09995 [Muricauda oceani]|uniref:Uncharacterized protein n=1 Tax=Flagellimonas oceani TaxID=2698672 RepID=A0A6G7J750_9FLAO|nr:hypothetical protein [Allomuricauda oceani]MBW8243131.1 hypothetical protein [Allomuricauda oceani]QII46520.1 hypothetical protein GVT53_18140 [Allomuricauda oceani]